MNKGPVAGVALAGLVVGGALMYTADSGGVHAQAYAIRVDASPRLVDEGDLVEFHASVTDSDGRAAPEAIITWDFGDGSRPAQGDLVDMNHRFADGGSPETTYTVRVGAGSSEQTVPVSVRNVAPSLRHVQRSRPALKGERVHFEAAASDPGMADTLTYSWDFGDGGTATGDRPGHTFQADGVYTVTVTVSDGDGGEDSETISVAIGEVGSFTISGDVSLPTTKVERVRVVGIPRGEGNTARCELRLDMQPESGDFGVVLRAHLVPGIGERSYTIGAVSEWDGMTRTERDQLSLFFADVSLPSPHANRDFNGTMVGGPFWSRGGRVDVDYFDGTYLELTYSATFVENIPAEFNPRTLFVEGTLARRITGGGLGSIFSGMTGGSASLYRCGREDVDTFAVESMTPAPNARNVAFLNPDIEIRFTRPVNPRTIRRAVQLDYRAPDSDTGVVRRPAAGVWEPVPGDPQAIRFVPSARLEDGVVHCVRVRSGVLGLRGEKGEILEGVSVPEYPAQYQDACVLTRIWPESREWALSTRVELEDFAAELYQASLAGDRAPLVAGKPTVARVYPYWSAADHVHEFAQVRSFPARVSVHAGGRAIIAPRRVEVRRPDLFDEEDGRHARNSINFFDWRPASEPRSMDVRPVMEPTDESGSVLDRWEGRSSTHTVWDRTEILSFDYYYIRAKGDCPNDPTGLCDWTETIHPEWRMLVRHLALEGAVFTTQNFPVIETQARNMGELWIDEPASGPCTWYEQLKDERCYNPGSAREIMKSQFVGERLFQLGRESYADVIVGFVPPGFEESWTGVLQTLSGDRSQRIVLIDPSSANPTTFAHEFGHFFELAHCPETTDEECPTSIFGFRVSPSGRSGLNKHDVEGNQEVAGFPPPLFPLMYPESREVRLRFITTQDYETLFDSIASAPRRDSKTATSGRPPGILTALRALASRPVFAQAPAGRVVVSGAVSDGVPTLQRVRHDPAKLATGRRPVGGDLTLQLLDASGTVLAEIPFGAEKKDASHGIVAGPSRFGLEVPAPAGLHAVRVTGPRGESAARTRSRRAPDVRGDATRSDSAIRLRWTSADPDGDEVRVSVFVRADDGPWRGVILETARTELALATTLLPPGDRLTARLEASDGFHVSSTDIDLGAGGPFVAEPMFPRPDAADVPVTTEIMAWLSAPLTDGRGRSLPLAPGRFTLTRDDGRAVVADVGYQHGTGLAILTPIAPLEPGTRYTATLQGVQDRRGAVLSRPLSWSFVTARQP